MKNTTIIIALFLINSLSFAQAGPKIEFATSDNTIDYGTISKQSDNGVRTIEFTNVGDAALHISNVLSTAGFSISSVPTGAIAPGKSGKFDIKYNMTTGPIRKTITVETDATNYDNGRIPLKIKGMVTE